MKATLNLFDHLLHQGRQHQQLRRYRSALDLYQRLARFRDLPGRVAEETQIRLAELHLKARRYRRAARHLAAALSHRPEYARYHYLLGACCHAEGPDGDPARAEEHYRRARELDPGHRKCQADLGLLLIETGRPDEGLEQLRDAVAESAGDVRLLQKLVKGLLQVGRADEARKALRTALFREPRSPRLRKMWADFQFQELRRRQEAERVQSPEEEPDGPTLLPFLPRAGNFLPPHTWAG